MTATKRGPRGGEGADFFPTPAWCVRRLVDATQGLFARRMAALEPAFGDGAIVRAITDYTRGDHFWTGNDLRPYDHCGLINRAYCGDYLATSLIGGAHDLAITNPPFSLVLPFAQKMCAEADWAIVLTREAWRGGNAAGRAWLRQHQPDVYRLPNRPSFAASITCTNRKLCGYKLMCVLDAPWARQCPDCGAKCMRTTSDSAEYAWLVWGPHSHRGKPGAVSLLAETPKAERRVIPRAT